MKSIAARFAVVVAVIVGGCAGPASAPQPSPTTAAPVPGSPTSASPVSTPGTAGTQTAGPSPAPVALECETRGYPCSLADVPGDVRIRTGALMLSVRERLASAQDAAAAVAWLSTQDDLAEASTDGATIRFRLDGGRAAWILTEQAAPTPDATETATDAASAATPLLRTATRPEPILDSPLMTVAGQGRAAKRAIVLSPFRFEMQAWDTSDQIASILRKTRGYEGGVTYLANPSLTSGAVTVATFKHLRGHEVVYVYTHGGRSCEGEEADICHGVIGAEPISGEPISWDSPEKGVELMTTADGLNHYALSADFFRAHYPGGLQDAVVVISGCYSALTDLQQAIQGTTSIYFGWDKTSYADTAGKVLLALFEGLSGGRTVGAVYEELGEDVVDRRLGARFQLTKRPAGGDLRIRELVTVIDPFSGKEITDATTLEIDGETDDGQPDAVLATIEVDGASAADLSTLAVQLSVDDLTTEPVLVATGKQLEQHRWRLELGIEVPDLHEGQRITLNATAQLPEGGISEQAASPTITGTSDKPDLGTVWEGDTTRIIGSVYPGVTTTIRTHVVWTRDPDQRADEDIVFHVTGGEMTWSIAGTDEYGCRFFADQVTIPLPVGDEADHLEFDTSGKTVTYSGFGELDGGPLVPVTVSCPGRSFKTRADGVWFRAPRDGSFLLVGSSIAGQTTSGSMLEWTFHRVR